MKTFSKAPRLARQARRCIEQGIWRSDEYVPSVRRLSGQWGVSNTTANRALRELAKQGIIHKDRNSGRYIITPPPNTPIRSQRTSFSNRIEELEHVVREGILHGTHPFVAGSALSIKNLCVKYHASRKNVSLALARVAHNSKLLEKTGRRYRVSLQNKGHSGSDLIMMVRRKDMSSSLMMRLVQAAEFRCNAIGWNRLSLCFSKSEIPAPHRIAGIIAMPHVLGSRGFPPNSDIPLVVLNRSGEHVDLPSGKCFELRFDYYFEGLQVANHLRENGHRHVALFCHLPLDLPWVQARIAALKSVYESNDHTDDLSLSIYATQGGQQWDNFGLRTGLRKHVENILNSPTSDTVFAGSNLMMSMYRSVEYTVNIMRLYDSTTPLFSHAANRKQITAWVGINDQVTICAYDYCRKQMPPSLLPRFVSFDNTTNAALYNISSLDSGYAEMGYLAVECISRPDQIRRSYGTTVSIRGNFVQRGFDVQNRAGPTEA